MTLAPFYLAYMTSCNCIVVLTSRNVSAADVESSVPVKPITSLKASDNLMCHMTFSIKSIFFTDPACAKERTGKTSHSLHEGRKSWSSAHTVKHFNTLVVFKLSVQIQFLCISDTEICIKCERQKPISFSTHCWSNDSCYIGDSFLNLYLLLRK